MRTYLLRGLLIAVPVVFLGYFFVYPVSAILVEALGGEGGWEFLGSATVRGAVWFTLWQAAVSTVLVVVAALPLTWVLST
ncbi:MAG: iron ABC transporter permease, partial [Acidimicrobiia bacterium]|nr:iron ABC transporter permease [Acidimicrobiia bacterium]